VQNAPTLAIRTTGLSSISFLEGGGLVGDPLYDEEEDDKQAEAKVFSLGGGTGTATGSDDSESLFTNSTLIGPESLFR